MKVRLKSDPARIGVLTEKSRQIAGRTQKQVMFADGTASFYYESALKIEGTTDDPLELLAQGELGRARDLRSHLTYIRLSGRLADLIYSMDTTNTDFYAYQFKPVLNFLESPSKGLLIADEVGLGKTIEAGLIWTELRSRFDARRLLVVCPAMLREKWQSELQQRFGIEATIADATELFKILKANKSHFAVIASMQGLRPRKGWNDDEDPTQDDASKLARFLKEMEHQEPLLVDLLIIDEAHYLRNPESMTAKLGKLLRPIADYMVLLSATSINLKNEDLYQLLNLVDEETFNQPSVFEMILEANKPLIEAQDRLRRKLTQEEFKNFIERAKGHPFLENNHQLDDLLAHLPTDAQLSDDTFRSKLAHRLENINLLGKAVSRTRKRDVQERRVEREVVAEYIPLTDTEREFYNIVTSFLRRYCQDRGIPSGFILATPQRQISSSMPAAWQAWRNKRNRPNLEEQLYEEDIGEDTEESTESTEKVGEVVEQLIHLSRHFDLQELLDNDSKFKRLQTLLRDYLDRYPQEKVILFAYFRQTLFYLKERLTKAEIICEVLVGGMRGNQQVINEFRENPQSKVLLLSEVGSEGIDLQFCRLLINYDLPWNPMKVEQRIGRIDRLGQQSPKITVWNLFYEDTIDARIYQRLFERLEIFKYALGDHEEVLGQEIRQLTIELMSTELTAEQEEKRIEQTRLVLANRRQLEETLEAEAVNLVAHGQYILNEVGAAKELNRLITDEDIWVFIRDFMQEHYRGCEFKRLKDNELVFDVHLSAQAKFEFDAFPKKKELYGYTNLAVNDPKPIRCEFKNKVTGKVYSGQKEIISQFHPLTRFVTAKIREKSVSFYPVVAVKLSVNDLPVNYLPQLSTGYYVFYSQLWSLEGLRTIEKVYFSAKLLGATNPLSEQEAEKLITYAALYGKDWEEGRNIVDLAQAQTAVEVFIGEAEEKYQSYCRQIQSENEDRATLQKGALIAHKHKQLEIQKGVLNKHHEEIKHLTARREEEWMVLPMVLPLAKVAGKVAEKESLIERKITNRESLIKATEGKMAKIESRVNYKLTEIENKKQLKSHYRELSLGLIYLT